MKKLAPAVALSVCCLLVSPAANAETTPVPASAATDSISQDQINDQLQKIGTPEWNADIQKLEDQGRIKETGHTDTTSEKIASYQVNDPNTGDRIGDFTVKEPKGVDRIGGKFDGKVPAIVFSQDDQKALQTGGMGAVTAMAAAWAAALSETVVGSVLSAGAIAFIGGTATYYVSKHGVCPGNQSLVVNALKQAHCE